MKNLTEKQNSKFAAVEAKLPEGYSYRLHDETSGEGSFSNMTVSGAVVWGVTVEKDGDSVGHAQKPDARGWLQAHTTCPAAERTLVRLLLNRATSALWHRQPNWSTAS
jgi:hypothetical protein